MTDPIANLEALHAAATSGPWYWSTSNSWRRLSAEHRDGGVLCPVRSHGDGHPDLSVREEDMELIVAMRNSLPAILRALKAAEFARDRLRAVASIFNDPRFTDRYEDGPACALVADELDAALAALTPTENPK
jgi:hypothetical protein